MIGELGVVWCSISSLVSYDYYYYDYDGVCWDCSGLIADVCHHAGSHGTRAALGLGQQAGGAGLWLWDDMTLFVHYRETAKKKISIIL